MKTTNEVDLTPATCCESNPLVPIVLTGALCGIASLTIQSWLPLAGWGAVIGLAVCWAVGSWIGDVLGNWWADR